MAERRPNVVFLLTDNQGAWTLGCYGNKDIRTPHLDLKEDPGERTNLVEQAAHAGRRKELRKRLDDFFSRHADPKYDLWRGGVSKASRLAPPKKP